MNELDKKRVTVWLGKEYLSKELRVMDEIIETLNRENYEELLGDSSFRTDIQFGVNYLYGYADELINIFDENWISCPFRYPPKDKLIRLIKMNKLMIQERLNEIENEDG